MPYIDTTLYAALSLTLRAPLLFVHSEELRHFRGFHLFRRIPGELLRHSLLAHPVSAELRKEQSRIRPPVVMVSNPAKLIKQKPRTLTGAGLLL